MHPWYLSLHGIQNMLFIFQMSMDALLLASEHQLNLSNLTTLATNTSVPTTSSQECLEYQHQPTPVMMSHRITTLLNIILIVLGFGCNIIGICIFGRKLRESSTAACLFCLAITDNVYLLMVFLTRSLSNLKCLYFNNSNLDIFQSNAFTCKTLQYLLDVASDISTCIILLVTVERYIACYHILVYKTKCTTRKSQIAITVLSASIIVLTIPHHFLYIEHLEQGNVCDVTEQYDKVFSSLYMAEATIFRIMPVFTIAVLNGLIIHKIRKRGHERMKNYSSFISANAGGGSIRESNRCLTWTLVTISTFYIICYQPILVCFTLSKLVHSQVVEIDMDTMIVFRNYSRTLYILGFCMNFVFYTCKSKVFREDLWNMFCIYDTK